MNLTKNRRLVFHEIDYNAQAAKKVPKKNL